MNFDKSNINYSFPNKTNNLWFIFPFASQIKSNIITSIYWLIHKYWNKDKYSKIVNSKSIRVGHSLLMNLLELNPYFHNNRNSSRNDVKAIYNNRREINHIDSLSSPNNVNNNVNGGNENNRIKM